MFKAYFYLSMEAVREAVKVIEEELILNYNDNTTNPVSSAFVGLPDTETQDGMRVSLSHSLISHSLILGSQTKSQNNPMMRH